MTEIPARHVRVSVGRRSLGVMALSVVLFVSACSYQPGIYNAIASGDGTTLDLSMNNCHGDYSVAVTETSDRVSVEITDNRTPISVSGDDCADNVRMNLDEPLGGRTLVNGTDGSVIDVTYYPWNQNRYSETEYRVALEAAARCIVKAEPDTRATVVDREGVPYLDVEPFDLPDGATQIQASAWVICEREYVEPLRR